MYQGSIENLRNKGEDKILLRTNDIQKTLSVLSENGVSGKVNEGCVEMNYFNDSSVADIIQNIIYKGIKVYRIQEEKTSLEDIFLNMTRKEHSL